ncbi:MAG TPA: hypothetical protein VHX42_01125 [Candidatus Babeliales bacterium]|jgi:hypothetical protein|nr:hypothetical protein [Candidatus Babeliales bacterium]
MSFSKISLFYFLFLSFTHIAAMKEPIQQSIQQKLSILDKKIVTMQTKVYYTIRKQTAIQNSLAFHQSRNGFNRHINHINEIEKYSKRLEYATNAYQIQTKTLGESERKYNHFTEKLNSHDEILNYDAKYISLKDLENNIQNHLNTIDMTQFELNFTY